jgi:hypothetical protein
MCEKTLAPMRKRGLWLDIDPAEGPSRPQSLTSSRSANV